MDKSRGKRGVDPLSDSKNGHILTRAIIDTIREPLIILGTDLHIIAASSSFYTKFGSSHKNLYGRKFYEIDNGVWNIPKLRNLLEKIIPKHTTIEEYEVENDFPELGRRIMLVNAREVDYTNDQKKDAPFYTRCY